MIIVVVIITLLVCADLRWNNVGLIGGRGLLSALEINRTLIKLELAGNGTPNDIQKSIGIEIITNQTYILHIIVKWFWQTRIFFL